MSEFPTRRRSGAAEWPVLRQFIDAEARFGAWMARRRTTAALYEFLRFGMKQAWACLFGGLMVFLLIATFLLYPKDVSLSRYDFLFLASVTLQIALLGFRLETMEEAKVIAAYHVVGTVMEIFKTSVGSWVYPEECFFRIAGVPLFSGFMYSCIGSYICRAWTLFHFEFKAHPPTAWLIALSAAIYLNFFTHHYVADLRWLLFIAAGVLFARTRVYFLNWHTHRWMPLLLGLVLVTGFIWLAENVGTITKTWIYPNQRTGWSIVSLGKFGAWFLLLIISYTLVALIKKPSERTARAAVPDDALTQDDAPSPAVAEPGPARV